MPLPNYTATIYSTATNYVVGAPFDSTELANLTAPASVTVAIFGGSPLWDAKEQSLEDPEGATIGRALFRRTFPVVCYPFTFADGDQDIHRDGETTLEGTLYDVLAGNFLWLTVTVDGRRYPAGTKVYPVRLVGTDTSPAYERGRRELTLNFDHRYLKV